MPADSRKTVEPVPRKQRSRTPLSSLWHTLLDRMGVEFSGPFQDSRGPIKQLLA